MDGHPISDNTDLDFLMGGRGETLETRLRAIEKALGARIEGLAKYYATSAGAQTERGKWFTAYSNGRIKDEGELIPAKVVSGDLSADAQISALQECAEEHFAVILANKPVECDLLIKRVEPQISRALYPDGLHLRIYSRLAWDIFRG